ncbi:uncharacterized protein LOC115385360 isoform X2 [Salarias fasciatus]|uniref:uncharacterized protein LOC115385360 isoform X2 n=1 Tax=Salarias fasciatus TaxID=181472 RepID=UPI0011770D73|nr:uncharacterized protein LOC115385360 isoform X2 [Salarias fasciatus]
MADGGCCSKESSRRKLRIIPQHDAEKYIQLQADKPGLREAFVNSHKGRGVFASKPFSKGDFIVEYRGKLLSQDSLSVIETYSETQAAYLFDFQWNGKMWCLDASLEDHSLGRLVNDEHKNPNCKMRTVQVDGIPHLCLFANRDIVPGEELAYDYGDSDWPWRKQIPPSPVATSSVDDDMTSKHLSAAPVEHVETSSSCANMIQIPPSSVATAFMDDDMTSKHLSAAPVEHVETSSSCANMIQIPPSSVATAFMDDDMTSKHLSAAPVEHVETSSSCANMIQIPPSSVATAFMDDDMTSKHLSAAPVEHVETSSSCANMIQIPPSSVATAFMDDDMTSKHLSAAPVEHVETSSSCANMIQIPPSSVATAFMDDDMTSKHLSAAPVEHVETSSSCANMLQIPPSPVATSVMDDCMTSKHLSAVPVEHVETSSSWVNKAFKSRIAKLKLHHDQCLKRYMSSEEKRGAIESQRTLLLHQFPHLDKQLQQLDNDQQVGSSESTDHSSHTDGSDVDYIPDTEGTGSDSDDSIPLSTQSTPLNSKFPLLSSTIWDSLRKKSTTIRHVKKRCTVSPEKESSSKISSRKKKRRFSPEKESNLIFSPEEESSSTFSPERESSSTFSSKKKKRRFSPEKESSLKISSKKKRQFIPEKESNLTFSPEKDSSSTFSPEKDSSSTFSPERESSSQISSKKKRRFIPEKESSSTFSPEKESSSTFSSKKKRRFSPEKESSLKISSKKKRRFIPEKESSSTFSPVKDSSSTFSPEKESSSTFSSKKKKRRSIFSPSKHSSSTFSSETESSSAVSPVKERSIHVASTSNTGRRRVYDKRNYCIYCSKATSKIARHLQTVHADKADVAKAFYYPKQSKERQVRLTILRNRGNFAHNINVVRNGTGYLAARYRTQKKRNGTDFIHCAHCQGLYSKKTLWKHVKVCPEKTREDAPQVGRKRVRSLCALTTPVSLEVSDGLQKILTHMNYDDVSQVVQNEKCILQLGQYMFNKLKNKGNNNDDYIRQKMREVGRLLFVAQKITPLKKMEEFFIPKNFPHVIRAVKEAAGYNAETNTYCTPSLALKLGHSLKKISSIVESNAMMLDDHTTADHAKSYRAIHDTRWEEFISSGALNTLKEAKWNVPPVLPFTEDVKQLNFHMENDQLLLERMLRISPTPENYAALAKVTLALAITFNRRRAGEVSRMSLAAFRSRNKSVLHEDVAECLTTFERKMCDFFARVEIRGKRGRMVPVLLKPSMVSAMELLAEKRESCGVLRENLFMFGRPEALSAYRGGECLQKYAKLCGAKHPEALTSTKLRKHIATMSQILNLDENECDQLADFLGHDIRIHRQYYRLPQGTLQLARMSKVLLAMEKGTVSQYKGMKLDDIEIDPEEKVPHSHEEEDDSSDEEGLSSTDMEHTNPGFDVSSSEPAPATPPTQEPARKSRRKWEAEEVNAVERHLMKFIETFTVPAKHNCMICLKSEPLALKKRTWTDVKNYVRNRITALKRQTSI